MILDFFPFIKNAKSQACKTLRFLEYYTVSYRVSSYPLKNKMGCY
jgi:hypothetical protein